MDEQAKKTVLRQFTYGLYAVLAEHHGDRGVFTANWLSQVSFEPPLVVVSVELESSTLPLMRASGLFVVCPLADGQRELAGALGKPKRRAGDKFAALDLETITTASGPAALTAALGYVACRLVSETAAGDSTLLLGEVIEAGVLNEGEPLTMRAAGFPTRRLGQRDPALFGGPVRGSSERRSKRHPPDTAFVLVVDRGFVRGPAKKGDATPGPEQTTFVADPAKGIDAQLPVAEDPGAGVDAGDLGGARRDGVALGRAGVHVLVPGAGDAGVGLAWRQRPDLAGGDRDQDRLVGPAGGLGPIDQENSAAIGGGGDQVVVGQGQRDLASGGQIVEDDALRRPLGDVDGGVTIANQIDASRHLLGQNDELDRVVRVGEAFLLVAGRYTQRFRQAQAQVGAPPERQEDRQEENRQAEGDELGPALLAPIEVTHPSALTSRAPVPEPTPPARQWRIPGRSPPIPPRRPPGGCRSPGGRSRRSAGRRGPGTSGPRRGCRRGRSRRGRRSGPHRSDAPGLPARPGPARWLPAHRSLPGLPPSMTPFQTDIAQRRCGRQLDPKDTGGTPPGHAAADQSDGTPDGRAVYPARRHERLKDREPLPRPAAGWDVSPVRSLGQASSFERA